MVHFSCIILKLFYKKNNLFNAIFIFIRILQIIFMFQIVSKIIYYIFYYSMFSPLFFYFQFQFVYNNNEYIIMNCCSSSLNNVEIFS